MSKPPIPETKNRYALCVGINKYHPSAQVGDLCCAENDAQTLYALLCRNGFAKEHCCLLTGTEATQEAIQKALRTFVLSKPQSDDLVVFYFAGHGLPIGISDAEHQSDVFLLSHDFSRQQISDEPGEWLEYPLRMGSLRTRFFERSRSKKVLFLFDSCYSGDFYGSSYRGDEEFLANSIEQAFAGTSEGRVVLSSCMPQQKAREDRQLRHGLFTYHLIEALEGRVPDAVGFDGWITISSLFDYLSRVLPQSQRPVRSGVEHGTFQLLRYPQLGQRKTSSASDSDQNERKRVEREQFLRALLIDRGGFIKDRLSSFVGRAQELEEIHRDITSLMPIGGYITITGQAGQGKSSIIAELVKEYGLEKTIHHFIPFNPGPDYQVSMLRDMMAQLILKYGLSDLYVATENRAALRDYFPKVLTEVVEKGGQEIIFIDGLDQLKEDIDGERDLSFLPTNPPPRVVFVLGARPNDTLRPLRLLKPHHEYRLPNLSRDDFDLILERRNVHLAVELATRFYQAMQENALYLDLMAKELIESGVAKYEEIIQKVAYNPENLFSLSVARLKRQPSLWREVIKPVLGVLLVTREPLSVWHIRKIVGREDDQIREGIERLGGLLAEDGQHRYSLFHLKLYDYLRQDERHPDKEYLFAVDEEKGWHRKLMGWCEQGDISTIWRDVKHDRAEQSRREYARQHYITHIYYAQEWPRLFSVLDEGLYGRGKVRYGPGTRAYAQDLYLGLLAAMWDGWTTQEALTYLPHIWRYTLLRSSLTSRADRYSLTMFEVLVDRGRESEALGLAELLTNPIRKMKVLMQIAQQLARQPGRERESIQLLLRACEGIKSIRKLHERASVLGRLSEALAKAQQWERAESVAFSIDDYVVRERTLREVGRWRTRALREQCKVLVQNHQWERAEVVAFSIDEEEQKVEALSELGKALAQARQWEFAEKIVRSIQGPEQKVVALGELGKILEQAQLRDRAEAVWTEAESAAHLVGFWERAKTLGNLSKALAQARQWKRAEEVARSIQDERQQAGALAELGKALAQAQQLEYAQTLWNAAESVARSIQDERQRAESLTELGKALTQAQSWEHATAVWSAAESVARSIGHGLEQGGSLQNLSKALAQARQWKRAEEVARSIQDERQRAGALAELGKALAQAQQWEQVSSVTQSINAMYLESESVKELVDVLIKSQQWIQAEAVIRLLIPEKQASAENLAALCAALIRAKEWERAKSIANLIRVPLQRALTLSDLEKALTKVEQWERAKVVGREAKSAWNEAESAARSAESDWSRTEALQELMRGLTQAHQWERLDAICNEVETVRPSQAELEQRARALGELGEALAQMQQWEQAETLWTEAEAVLHAHKIEDQRANVQRRLGQALAEVEQWEQAERVIRSIQEPQQQTAGLKALAMALIRAKRLARAEIVTSSLQEPLSALEVLASLGIALMYAQEQKRAEAVWSAADAIVRSIRQPEQRAKTLPDLGQALIQAQQWERAEATINSLDSHAQKLYLLKELAKALSRSELRAQADVIWNKVEAMISATDITGLKELGKDLSESMQPERAEAVWSKAEALIIYKGWDLRENELRELGKTLVRSQHWGYAERIYRLIKSWELRSESLQELGRTLAEAQHWEYAEKIVNSIDDWVYRSQALREVSNVLAQSGRWHEAARIARSIDIGEERALALSTLGKVLAQHYQWEEAKMQWAEAESAISLIRAEWERGRALRDLSQTLAEAQQWEWSERLASSIQVARWRAEALVVLGGMFAHDQQVERATSLWTEAQKIAGSIEELTERAKMLRVFCEAVSQAQQWEWAERIAYAIPIGAERAETMQQLGKTLIQAEQWDRAVILWAEVQDTFEEFSTEIMQSESLSESIRKPLSSPEISTAQNIEDIDSSNADRSGARDKGNRWREEILYEVASRLRKSGAYDQLLHMVQHMWLHADTMTYAVDLLPLSAGLIHLNTKISTDFCEAFTWADAFLKE